MIVALFAGDEAVLSNLDRKIEVVVPAIALGELFFGAAKSGWPKANVAKLAEIRGNDIVYLKKLEGAARVTTPMLGFGPNASDYDIRVEDSHAGVGVRSVGDRPPREHGPVVDPYGRCGAVRHRVGQAWANLHLAHCLHLLRPRPAEVERAVN